MKKIFSVTILLYSALTSLNAQTPPATPATAAPPASSAPPATTTAATPNLSGTWKLNLDKSEFGQIPPPSSETDVFTQNANDLKIAISSDNERGKEVYTIPLTIGGDETPTPKDAFPDSAEFKILSSKGEWQTGTLVVLQKISYQGGAGTIRSIYTLSLDGKVLTKESHISLDLGEFDYKTVFDKQ
jgi:hypothetical protein